MPTEAYFMLIALAVTWMVFTVGGMLWFLSCVEKYLRIQTELYNLKRAESLQEAFRIDMIVKGHSNPEKASFETVKLYRMPENP